LVKFSHSACNATDLQASMLPFQIMKLI
jgi:hypothetical protein